MGLNSQDLQRTGIQATERQGPNQSLYFIPNLASDDSFKGIVSGLQAISKKVEETRQANRLIAFNKLSQEIEIDDKQYQVVAGTLNEGQVITQNDRGENEALPFEDYVSQQQLLRQQKIQSFQKQYNIGQSDNNDRIGVSLLTLQENSDIEFEYRRNLLRFDNQAQQLTKNIAEVISSDAPVEKKILLTKESLNAAPLPQQERIKRLYEATATVLVSETDKYNEYVSSVTNDIARRYSDNRYLVDKKSLEFFASKEYQDRSNELTKAFVAAQQASKELAPQFKHELTKLDESRRQVETKAYESVGQYHEQARGQAISIALGDVDSAIRMAFIDPNHASVKGVLTRLDAVSKGATPAQKLQIEEAKKQIKDAISGNDSNPTIAFARTKQQEDMQKAFAAEQKEFLKSQAYPNSHGGYLAKQEDLLDPNVQGLIQAGHVLPLTEEELINRFNQGANLDPTIARQSIGVSYAEGSLAQKAAFKAYAKTVGIPSSLLGSNANFFQAITSVASNDAETYKILFNYGRMSRGDREKSFEALLTNTKRVNKQAANNFQAVQNYFKLTNQQVEDLALSKAIAIAPKNKEGKSMVDSSHVSSALGYFKERVNSLEKVKKHISSTLATNKGSYNLKQIGLSTFNLMSDASYEKTNIYKQPPAVAATLAYMDLRAKQLGVGANVVMFSSGYRHKATSKHTEHGNPNDPAFDFALNPAFVNTSPKTNIRALYSIVKSQSELYSKMNLFGGRNGKYGLFNIAQDIKTTGKIPAVYKGSLSASEEADLLYLIKSANVMAESNPEPHLHVGGTINMRRLQYVLQTNNHIQHVLSGGEIGSRTAVNTKVSRPQVLPTKPIPTTTPYKRSNRDI